MYAFFTDKKIDFYLIFRPPSQHQEVNRRRRHTNILLACITAVFFICWGPLVFYIMLFEFTPEILPERTVMASVGYTLSLLFGMLTPIANPLFYGILNDGFREVLKEKFPWMFPSRSVIGNLTIQSLALGLPAIPKFSRFKIRIDNVHRIFSIEKSLEDGDGDGVDDNDNDDDHDDYDDKAPSEIPKDGSRLVEEVTQLCDPEDCVVVAVTSNNGEKVLVKRKYILLQNLKETAV